MKYLKRFNESVDESISEIEKIADFHLADLKDKGYDVIIHQTKDKSGVATWLGNRGKLFIWESIADYYISFASELAEKFDVTEVIAHVNGGALENFNIDNIINDDIEVDELTYLVIVAKEKINN